MSLDPHDVDGFCYIGSLTGDDTRDGPNITSLFRCNQCGMVLDSEYLDEHNHDENGRLIV